VTALEPFAYGGHPVRTVLVDGEAWFVAADVTGALGLSNGRDAVSRLDSDGVGNADIIDSMGRTQSARVINEPGLYELIFQSRVSGALEFKRWVTHEVLPTIRSTGQFGSAIPTNLADALELAAVEIRKSEALEAKIVADAPKVEAFDALMDSDGAYSMDNAAKLLGIGRNTMYRKLRELGVILRGSTLPAQRYAHHFKLVAGTYRDNEGSDHPTSTTKVRPSALPFLATKLGTSLAVTK
jgi:anti-repressor protein